MNTKVRVYTGAAIDVSWDQKRCIHAAECIRGLPAVFDTQQRPWIQPDSADADAVAAVVVRCPTGALHFERKDGGSGETIPQTNTIHVTEAGPLYVRGDVTLVGPNGNVILRDVRIALCRCGASTNKPFCDNSHRQLDFGDEGRMGANGLATEGVENSGPLTITPSANGPLLVQGATAVIGADGETVYSQRRTTLCRCGGSANKPFCDGSHTHIGFQS